MNNENKNSVFHSDYIPSIIKIGRFTNLLGVLLALLPAAVCIFIYGQRPQAEHVLAGFLLIASMEGIFWFIEPISYYGVLGIPGTYMSFLSGNISNLRLPVSIAVQNAAEVEPGSEKGTIISAVGVAVSVMVNIAILTMGVILGSSVLSLVPAGVVTALTNIVPALFGALFAQQVISDLKTGIVAAVLAVVVHIVGYYTPLLNWVPGGSYWFMMVLIIFGTILIGRAIATKKN